MPAENLAVIHTELAAIAPATHTRWLYPLARVVDESTAESVESSHGAESPTH